jgi:hypothetical protein
VASSKPPSESTILSPELAALDPLAAIRALHASGQGPKEAADRVWQALQRAARGDPSNPSAHAPDPNYDGAKRGEAWCVLHKPPHPRYMDACWELPSRTPVWPRRILRGREDADLQEQTLLIQDEHPCPAEPHVGARRPSAARTSGPRGRQPSAPDPGDRVGSLGQEPGAIGPGDRATRGARTIRGLSSDD